MLNVKVLQLSYVNGCRTKSKFRGVFGFGHSLGSNVVRAIGTVAWGGRAVVCAFVDG